jgi:protease II
MITPSLTSIMAWLGRPTELCWRLYVPMKHGARAVSGRGNGNVPTVKPVAFSMKPTSCSMFIFDQSGDQRFLIVGSHSSSSSGSLASVFDSQRGILPAHCVAPRQPDIEYDIVMVGEQLYMRTNQQAVNFCVQTRTLNHTEWQPYITHRDDTSIKALDAFQHHFVVWVRRGGLRHVEVYPHDQQPMHCFESSDAAYDVTSIYQQTYHGSALYLSYATPITTNGIGIRYAEPHLYHHQTRCCRWYRA